MEDGYLGSKPWSYGNKNQIKKYLKDKSKKDIENFLNRNEIYTRFKQHRKVKKYSPIYVLENVNYSRLTLFFSQIQKW